MPGPQRRPAPQPPDPTHCQAKQRSPPPATARNGAHLHNVRTPVQGDLQVMAGRPPDFPRASQPHWHLRHAQRPVAISREALHGQRSQRFAHEHAAVAVSTLQFRLEMGQPLLSTRYHRRVTSMPPTTVSESPRISTRLPPFDEAGIKLYASCPAATRGHLVPLDVPQRSRYEHS